MEFIKRFWFHILVVILVSGAFYRIETLPEQPVQITIKSSSSDGHGCDDNMPDGVNSTTPISTPAEQNPQYPDSNIADKAVKSRSPIIYPEKSWAIIHHGNLKFHW